MTKDSKAKLLYSAFTEFAKNGFMGATTRDIAERANINISSILYYFGGKRGMYAAALENIVDTVKHMSADVFSRYQVVIDSGKPDEARAFLKELVQRFLLLLCGENISKDYDSLKDCKIVFVCTPMNATLKILDKLESILPETTIVTDVCSLKEFVSKRKYSFRFIPSHPMAGTENSGWENSFAGLFQGAKWVITPIDGVIMDEQSELEKIIESMGAKIVITTPEEHDKAVALVSHMPILIAQALCKNIKDGNQDA